jgi:hypothetical protein
MKKRKRLFSFRQGRWLFDHRIKLRFLLVQLRFPDEEASIKLPEVTLNFTSDSVKRAASQFLDEEPAYQLPVYGVTVHAPEEEVDMYAAFVTRSVCCVSRK